jgi:iron complex transport system ATP-binding protein
VLVVIHDLNVAQQYCDQLILMDKGKIIKKDIPINVLTDEILRETYNIKATRLKTNDQNIIVPTSLAD